MSEPQPVFVPAFSAQASLVHGFSTRVGGVSRCYRRNGDLNLGFTKDDDAADVAENRRRFLRSLRAEDFRSYGLLRQIHSTVLHTIPSVDEGAPDFTLPAVIEGDALMTDVSGVLLTVQVADCIPVLLFDPDKRAVAAIHAGWRGTAAGIVERTISAMASRYGSQASDLIAAIGPGIGPASYAVSEDLRVAFAERFAYADELFSQRGGQMYLDLWQANQRQLRGAGMRDDNIHVLGLDTATDTDQFFSHRAEKGLTGRMMAAIGMVR